MQYNISTIRLQLNQLTASDAEFIFELVNTEEWKKFIGDRNIKTGDDAIPYIETILANQAVNYWVVKLITNQIPIGVITFIKRDYLPNHDIGFAFLPSQTKKGYAREATTAVLKEVLKDETHTQIMATTVRANINSIRLLEKFGMKLDFITLSENEELLVYKIAREELMKLLQQE